MKFRTANKYLKRKCIDSNHLFKYKPEEKKIVLVAVSQDQIQLLHRKKKLKNLR